jgi:hypothetical protein
MLVETAKLSPSALAEPLNSSLCRSAGRIADRDFDIEHESLPRFGCVLAFVWKLVLMTCGSAAPTLAKGPGRAR